ncbi:MAG: hypothetical protein ABI594_14380 [Ginsengibacter sp.]
MWWLLSLIILISCSIFAYRMIISSYEFLPADKRFLFRFYKNSNSQSAFPVQGDALKILRNKVQHVEDNTSFYQVQFSKFQDRLQNMEERYAMVPNEKSSSVNNNVEREEEDWKEMFYEENASREKLENELDFTRQSLEEAENKLNDIDSENSGWKELQSDYESRLLELQSSQAQIDRLQRELAASVEREKELEQLLLTEITMRESYSLLQQKYTQLLSEADDLMMRSVEINKKDIDHQSTLRHQWQLESLLALCKDENLRLKNDVEQFSKKNPQSHFLS